MGNDTGGTTVLHSLPNMTCSHLDCENDSVLGEIETAWPDILSICPETVSSSPSSFGNRKPLPLSREFNIHGVQYELVGRVHYNGGDVGHYTCDVPIQDRLYKADDMKFEGDFVDVGAAEILEDPDYSVHLLVYHHVSEQMVCD
jgi:hypothetical protein